MRWRKREKYTSRWHFQSVMQSSYPAYQDFCMLVLRKFREEDEEEFIKVMFKVGGRPGKKEKCVNQMIFSACVAQTPILLVSGRKNTRCVGTTTDAATGVK